MKSNKSFFIIPTPISEGNPFDFITKNVIENIYLLDFFIVEEVRTARRFLSSINYPKPINEVNFLILNKDTNKASFIEQINSIPTDINIGLMSEAGLPCIADPGNITVEWAHKNNYKVIPLSGASSITLALMSSGFNGQQFTFHGYLPIKKDEQTSYLKQIVKEIRNKNISQIFIETPYRNNKILEIILQTVPDDIVLNISSDINGSAEFIKSATIANWKSNKVEIEKKPTIFILGNWS